MELIYTVLPRRSYKTTWIVDEFVKDSENSYIITANKSDFEYINKLMYKRHNIEFQNKNYHKMSSRQLPHGYNFKNAYIDEAWGHNQNYLNSFVYNTIPIITNNGGSIKILTSADNIDWVLVFAIRREKAGEKKIFDTSFYSKKEIEFYKNNLITNINFKIRLNIL